MRSKPRHWIPMRLKLMRMKQTRWMPKQRKPLHWRPRHLTEKKGKRLPLSPSAEGEVQMWPCWELRSS